MIDRRAGKVGQPYARFGICGKPHVWGRSGKVRHQRNSIHSDRCGDARKLEQRGRYIDGPNHIGTGSAAFEPRIDDEQRHPVAHVAAHAITLSPGVVLEELHSVIRINHNYGVLSQATRANVLDDAPYLVIKIAYATIIEIDDLRKIEFLPAIALAPNDLPGIGE